LAGVVNSLAVSVKQTNSRWRTLGARRPKLSQEVNMPLNINAATVEEIANGLPGFDRALACRVATYRHEVGPFRRIEELAAVEGITFEMARSLHGVVVLSDEDEDEPPGFNITVHNGRCDGGVCRSHRVTARFERQLRTGDKEIRHVLDQTAAVFDEQGHATLGLPPRERLRGDVVFQVSAPDGRDLGNEVRIDASQLANRIELSFEPARTIDLAAPQDGEALERRRVRGQVIDLRGPVSGKRVVLYGATVKNPSAQDFRALATEITDVNGAFRVLRPRGLYSEAYGQVLVGENPRIPLHLTDAGVFPETVLLVIESDRPSVEAKEPCDCDSNALVPRAPEDEDLGSTSGTFSQDLGGGCVNFTKPDRVLEEFTYQFVVRTTDPVVRPLKLEDPEIELEVPANFLDAIKNRTSLYGLFDDSTRQGTGTESSGTARSTVTRTALKLSAVKSLLKRPGLLSSTSGLADVVLASKTQSLLDTLRLFRPKPPGRVEISCSTPVDWDDEPTAYQACTVAHGHVLKYKQQWVADGYSMGTLLYSLPLAPGQKKLIAVVDWERREQAIRSEVLTETEQLESSLSRDRSINEIVNAALSEHVEGNSEAFSLGMGAGSGHSSGAGGAGSYGGFGLAGGLGTVLGNALALGWGSSSASQDASRTVSSSALQALRDRTRQAASAMRGRRATVVETVTQGERAMAQSESVANYNHCHAITVQYFEVLRHLLVRHRLADVQECLFIPLQMSRFTPEKALQWREPLVRFLRARDLVSGFGALDRIANDYEGSNLPEGSYAEAAIDHLSGSLKLRFQFVPPESDEYEPAQWQWFAGHSGAFGLSAAGMHASLKAAKETQAVAFHRIVAPKLARKLTDELVLFAETPHGELELPLDLTLASEYAHDTALNVTVRTRQALRELARLDVTAIRIEPVSADTLPAGSRIVVEAGHLWYRTRYASGYIFRESHLDDDLTDTDGVFLTSPPSREELRRPRDEDLELRRRLLEHLNDHLEYYHKGIWTTMNSDRRYMMLDGFKLPNGRSVASVVDNQLIGVIGNSLVMPVARGLRLDPTFSQTDGVSLLDHYKPAIAEDPLRIALPTKGVYTEAVMGQCNSCEHKEEDRFWRWEESPIPDSPTPLQPISTDTRRAQPSNLAAQPPSAPIISMQQPAPAPDPTGLLGALHLLGNSNLFRDVTGLEGNQRNAIEALKNTLQAAQQFGKEAAEVAKTFGQYATSMGMQQATSQDMDRIQRAIQTARGQGLITDEQAGALTHSALRGMIGQGAVLEPGQSIAGEARAFGDALDHAHQLTPEQQSELMYEKMNRLGGSQLLDDPGISRSLERANESGGNVEIFARRGDESVQIRNVSEDLAEERHETLVRFSGDWLIFRDDFLGARGTGLTSTGDTGLRRWVISRSDPEFPLQLVEQRSDLRDLHTLLQRLGTFEGRLVRITYTIWRHRNESRTVSHVTVDQELDRIFNFFDDERIIVDVSAVIIEEHRIAEPLVFGGLEEILSRPGRPEPPPPGDLPGEVLAWIDACQGYVFTMDTILHMDLSSDELTTNAEDVAPILHRIAPTIDWTRASVRVGRDHAIAVWNGLRRSGRVAMRLPRRDSAYPLHRFEVLIRLYVRLLEEVDRLFRGYPQMPHIDARLADIRAEKARLERQAVNEWLARRGVGPI
jgi:hypothetical protein